MQTERYILGLPGRQKGLHAGQNDTGHSRHLHKRTCEKAINASGFYRSSVKIIEFAATAAELFRQQRFETIEPHILHTLIKQIEPIFGVESPAVNWAQKHSRFFLLLQVSVLSGALRPSHRAVISERRKNTTSSS